MACGHWPSHRGALWCHHQAVLDVNGFADDVMAPSFGSRIVLMVTQCGRGWIIFANSSRLKNSIKQWQTL
jgi:hypothetical protein